MFRKIALMVALILISGAASADTPAQARKKITALYAKEAAAFARKDAEGVVANYAPDFVSVSRDGERASREQRLYVQQQLCAQLEKARLRIQIIHFSFSGQTATARVKRHFIFIGEGSEPLKKRSGTGDQVTDELWIKQDGKWMIKQSVYLKAQRKIGKEERRF